MENKKLLLIVNPCSGKAKMRPALLGVVEIFTKADFDVTVYPTKEREDATKKVATLKGSDTTGYTAKNLKKNKTYYFKIRAYKTYGSTYHGAYTKSKKA